MGPSPECLNASMASPFNCQWDASGAETLTCCRAPPGPRRAARSLARCPARSTARAGPGCRFPRCHCRFRSRGCRRPWVRRKSPFSAVRLMPAPPCNTEFRLKSSCTRHVSALALATPGGRLRLPLVPVRLGCFGPVLVAMLLAVSTGCSLRRLLLHLLLRPLLRPRWLRGWLDRGLGS